MLLKEEIFEIVKNAVEKIGDIDSSEIIIEKPGEISHGDYSTNIALKYAKKIKKSPLKIAEILKSEIKSDLFEKIEIVKPGFVNFFVSDKYYKEKLQNVLEEKKPLKEKVNVEFISANPTGPLTLGNGRGGFCGDVLSNILKEVGYEVTKEYYINNIGNQIEKLGHSVLEDKEAVYKGEYIKTLKEKLSTDLSLSPMEIGEKSSVLILEEMIKPTIKKMGIDFDVWFSEKDLYEKKEIEEAIKDLSDKDLIYKKEEALWFKSKKMGDDKDRVLIKKDGTKTYFASDVAYLKNKHQRGFKKIVIFLGADHHGYLNRLKAAALSIGFKEDNIKMIVMQLVRLFKEGKEFRMSKRAGNYVTLDELIDEVGLDASRFFFLMRGANSHLNFDLDLAKKQSKENPVFYVQYAYARICSILKKQTSKGKFQEDLITTKEEMDLIKQLVYFPEVVENIAKDQQIQRLPQYVLSLADSFHKFYEKCKVISDNSDLTESRLFLLSETEKIFKKTFNLLGISAPKKM